METEPVSTMTPARRLLNAGNALAKGSARPARETAIADTSFRDEMTGLFGSILPLIDERGAMVLNLVAATHGEGVTTVALGLAAAAARRDQCRTLYLKIEPEGGSAKLPDKRSSALQQFAETGAVVPATRVFDGVSVLTSVVAHASDDGPKPQDVRDLYEWARRNYALTIVDCPPVLGPNNSAAICRIADGTMLVVKADDTRVQVVKRARDTLESAGAQILGVVLNRRRNLIPAPLYRFL